MPITDQASRITKQSYRIENEFRLGISKKCIDGRTRRCKRSSERSGNFERSLQNNLRERRSTFREVSYLFGQFRILSNIAQNCNFLRDSFYYLHGRIVFAARKISNRKGRGKKKGEKRDSKRNINLSRLHWIIDNLLWVRTIFEKVRDVIALTGISNVHR